MTRTAVINRFKNHININANNNAANADNALVELLINRHTVNNVLIMKCFILKRSTELLTIAVQRVCQIEFAPGYGDLLPGN